MSTVFFSLMESRRLRNAIVSFCLLFNYLFLIFPDETDVHSFHEAWALIVELVSLKKGFPSVFTFFFSSFILGSVFTIIIKWIDVSWKSNIHFVKNRTNSTKTTPWSVWIKRWGLPPYYQKVQYMNLFKITIMIYFILWSKSEFMSDCGPAVDVKTDTQSRNEHSSSSLRSKLKRWQSLHCAKQNKLVIEASHIILILCKHSITV